MRAIKTMTAHPRITAAVTAAVLGSAALVAFLLGQTGVAALVGIPAVVLANVALGNTKIKTIQWTPQSARINPASGLPMGAGGTDSAGNPYGVNNHLR